MAEKKEASSTMRSLERAIDVLEVLEEAGRSLRLADIAQRSSLHVATTQRILSVLESRGRVEKDALGYRAGVNLIFGANAYLTTSPLVAAARPVLQELAAETRLTSSLFVRSGWYRAVVARVHGELPLRYELPIGAKLPLHLGAGKVLAAAMGNEEVDSLIAHLGELDDSRALVGNEQDFRDDLERITMQGYHVARGERIPGTLSVSAPVRSVDTGNVLGALTVGAAVGDVDDHEIEPLINEVRRAAAAVRTL